MSRSGGVRMDSLLAKTRRRGVNPDRELIMQLIDQSLVQILEAEHRSPARSACCDALLDLRLAALQVMDLDGATATAESSDPGITFEVAALRPNDASSCSR